MAEGPPGERYGHVKISRKAYETDPFWNEPREFSRWEAWEYMIQAAGFKPTQWTAGGPVIRLSRGETPPLSLSYLCRAWRWSTKKVRVFLDLLISEERVTKGQETPQGHTYMLVNYDTYQGSGAQRGHSEGKAGAQLGQESEAVKQESITTPLMGASGENWVSSAIDLWRDKAGEPNAGRLGKAMKPLEERWGAKTVLLVMDYYLDNEDAGFATPERLAQNFVKWGKQAKEARNGTSKRSGKRGADGPRSWDYDNTTDSFEGFDEPDPGDTGEVSGRNAA